MTNKNITLHNDHKATEVEKSLLNDLKHLIENTKNKIIYTSNAELVLLHWKIGKRVQEDILQNKRADYGDKIVATLSHNCSRLWERFYEVVNFKDDPILQCFPYS